MELALVFLFWTVVGIMKEKSSQNLSGNLELLYLLRQGT